MANQPVASSLPPSWGYHVFLSFRGEDTRTNFTDHLYHALVGREIKTFIDRDLRKGEEISPTLLKAIKESRISLVILSKNYADSRWCLEELVKIHQCRESKEQIILPVFYKVDPSHVRHQTGSYGDSFKGHERFQDKEVVLRWRRALTEVANLSGYPVKEEDYETTKINNIVQDILDLLKKEDEGEDNDSSPQSSAATVQVGSPAVWASSPWGQSSKTGICSICGNMNRLKCRLGCMKSELEDKLDWCEDKLGWWDDKLEWGKDKLDWCEDKLGWCENKFERGKGKLACW